MKDLIRNLYTSRAVLRYACIVKKDLYNKVLRRFDMQDCKRGYTSITKGNKLNLNQCPKMIYK